MVKSRVRLLPILFLLLLGAGAAYAQQAGGIRGMVYDSDFDAALPAARVTIAETGAEVTATDEGNYAFNEVAPGNYTLVFSKEGYTRQVKADVVVSAGRMTEVDASMSGEFFEMEEFVVQDVQIGGGTEAALLELRIQSPALMDSISADLMSQAGASDAAGALNLVAGATVQDGKYAVIRGLPDRYVNSQMNGVRLPTADADKRAVELDQFPSAAIESVQVSKTFTPDQQGDASGGAVNVRLKGIPDELVAKISAQIAYTTAATGSDEFLSYDGGGVGFLGMEDRDIPDDDEFGGAVGVENSDAPIDYKWSATAGGKYDFEQGFTLGGLLSVFYERDNSLTENGIDDKYWVENPGDPMTPQYVQGTPTQGDFKTQLFDVTESQEEVKWGALGVLGIETENHSLTLANLYTRVAQDVATLAEDTRGKEFYFPGYDVDDPRDPGNRERDAAPYIRTETLEYTERETRTHQLSGRHTIPIPDWKLGDVIGVLDPEIDWSVSNSVASLYQPDKRQFGSLWWAESYNPGFPPYVPPSTDPAVHLPFKPAANFTLGNLQRIWKEITEESNQYAVNAKFPFEQWTGDEGYLKFGLFNDEVRRDYTQSSFSNFGDNTSRYVGPWEDFWSEAFPDEDHPVSPADIDVDYEGEQNISAWYYMADIPLTSWLKIIGGARHESTELSIINYPEKDVTWLPPGATGPVTLNPGDADVAFEQEDVLPAIGFELKPIEQLSLRGSYSETVARQTFKELSPIQQQEFLGSDVFVGNPFLRMSALENYDLRADWTPLEGSLVSLSWFKKDIVDPIEYVQRIADFSYTTAVNYPEGQLSGYEVELRQELGRFWGPLEGLAFRGNATFIDSEVTLPEEEAAGFDEPNILAPMDTRDMTNAPEHLYNLFLTYELKRLGLEGTELGLFYTVKGDTLIAGAGQSKGNFIPDVYQTEYGTLNFSLTQKLGEHFSLKLQAKNLLDPDIETVYRSDYIGEDVTKTSYQKGMEFSLSVSAEF